jgi:hypothetical protein
MYEIARIGEGLVRVLELTIEGATFPVLVLGVIALVVALCRRARPGRDGLTVILVLAVPATVFFLQFVAIGAGKPAEYGRFGVFTNTALAIAAACLLVRRWTRLREIVNWIPATFVVLWVALPGMLYLRGFHVDAGWSGSRMQLAVYLGEWSAPEPMIGVAAEPAPYCCPPLNFSRTEVRYFHGREHFEQRASTSHSIFIEPVDRRVPGWDDRARMFKDPTSRRTGKRPMATMGPVHTYWPLRSYGRPSGARALIGLLDGKETQVSWANKPLAVTFKIWNFDTTSGPEERTYDPRR